MQLRENEYLFIGTRLFPERPDHTFEMIGRCLQPCVVWITLQVDPNESFGSCSDFSSSAFHQRDGLLNVFGLCRDNWARSTASKARGLKFNPSYYPGFTFKNLNVDLWIKADEVRTLRSMTRRNCRIWRRSREAVVFSVSIDDLCSRVLKGSRPSGIRLSKALLTIKFKGCGHLDVRISEANPNPAKPH